MLINYQIKVKKEDFIVNEVSLIPSLCSLSEADYSYLVLAKRGFSTFDALDEIRLAYNLRYEDVTAQGLKDENGLTTQLIALKKIISVSDLEKFNSQFKETDYNLQIKTLLGYGRLPFCPGSLHGNNFTLIIRDLTKYSAELFYDYCRANKFISFINYYDSQRFGLAGGPFNAHLIGKALVYNNWLAAYQELLKTKNREVQNTAPLEINNIECLKFFKSINPAKISFFIDAYNSYLWNKGVSEYLYQTEETYQSTFSRMGPLNLPANNIFSIKNIYSINGLELERNSYQTTSRIKRRNLVVTTTVYPFEITPDELHEGKFKIKIDFFLPPGSYATMLVRQIFSKLSYLYAEKNYCFSGPFWSREKFCQTGTERKVPSLFRTYRFNYQDKTPL